jgi:hypothetical protein
MCGENLSSDESEDFGLKVSGKINGFPPPLPETGEVNLLSEVVSFPSDNFIRVSFSYSVQQLEMF